MPGLLYPGAVMGPADARAPRRDLLLTEYAASAGLCRCCQHSIPREERSDRRVGMMGGRIVPKVWCDHCQFLHCERYWRRHGHPNAVCRGNVKPTGKDHA